MSESDYERRDRRESDRRLDKIETRLASIEAELKYTVVKREGPVIDRINKMADSVRNLETQIATRREIQDALAAQTRQLRNTAEFTFSRRAKIISAIGGIFLIAINLLQIVWHP